MVSANVTKAIQENFVIKSRVNLNVQITAFARVVLANALPVTQALTVLKLSHLFQVSARIMENSSMSQKLANAILAGQDLTVQGTSTV